MSVSRSTEKTGVAIVMYRTDMLGQDPLRNYDADLYASWDRYVDDQERSYRSKIAKKGWETRRRRKAERNNKDATKGRE